MSTRTNNEEEFKPASHVFGIVLATLLAVAAVVSAFVNPTELAARPASHGAAEAVGRGL